MTTGPGTSRLSTSETARGLLAALSASRPPAPPESSVEIGVTAKRLHTWTVTVRGVDPEECARIARRLDSELSAAFASELDDDTLAGKLAASVVAQEGKR